ncbi:hypothetical protein UFOVP190_61 [uncultured Caudovirales phage]|uniref:Phage tail lysozyme domain-containing protein n=1 Tax=uncultured Caudovirales phage TaxID=2100421 RepID=A0A6J7WGF8_9CAUD|nr:hypothetical protein UFOVP190_61 [uncultured Caudovirales phage]
MAIQQKLPPPPADVVAAADTLAAKYGVNRNSILAVWAVESGYKTDIAGGAGGAYVGMFQLNAQYVPDFTERALGTRYTPDQYRQLSAGDQAKVQDYYWQQAGIKPGFFTGDINVDTAKAWALQLAPSNAKNIDYTNPNAVISNTVQADLISESRGTVTVGSTNGALSILNDVPAQTSGPIPLNSVQTLNLLDSLGPDQQQTLLDAYNQTNSRLGLAPVQDINVQSFLNHTQAVINTASKEYDKELLTAMGLDYDKVLQYSAFRETTGELIPPLARGTLTASNIVSNAQLSTSAGTAGQTSDPNGKIIAVGVALPDGSAAAMVTPNITKLSDSSQKVVNEIEGGRVEYIVGNNNGEATRTVLIYDNTGRIVGAGTDMADATSRAATNGANTDLLTAANQDYSDKGQFAIANMDRSVGNTVDPAVNSPTTAPSANPVLVNAYNSTKVQEQPDRPNSDYDPIAGTPRRVDISGFLNQGSNSPSATDGAPAKKKIMVSTELIPNPVHGLASYTYTWTLWWLGIKDYNAMMAGADVGVGVAYNLSNQSYVIAEDSGLYPDRRHPATLGLNYNIQDVEFESVVGMNKMTKSSSMITGTMTIIEPYGVSLLNSLIQAATDPNTGLPGNYVAQPYMLELNFVGYDDQGNPIPGNQVGLTRKRFPIRLLTFKVGVSGKGAEYKISFCPTGSTPHHLKDSFVPQNTPITAKTVGEFFDKFAASLNQYQRNEVAASLRQFADAVQFDIDPTIRKSAIVDPKKTGLAKSDPDSKGKTIDVTTNTFSIPHSMSIIDVIHKIMPSCQFFIDQLGAQKPNQAASQEQIYSHFKITTQVVYAGQTASGATIEGAFDNYNNRRNMIMTYGIHQYTILDPTHSLLPQGSNSSLFVLKDYQYTYTGKNIDVLDFKLQFDTTYYTAIQSYTNRIPSYRTTEATAVNKFLDKLPRPTLGIGALSNLVKEFAAVPQVNPQVFKPVVNDENLTKGGNQKERSEVVKVADVGKSMFSGMNGDMMTIDLQIVGDPTLIKQDDWLYVPSPNTSKLWGELNSQADFVKKYGHVRTENGTMVIKVTVNTPLDIDTDYNNTGLVFPPPKTTPAVFSGLYKILTIKNTFSRGVFTQTLRAIRFINADLVGTFSDVQNKQRIISADAEAQEGGFYGSNSVGLNQSNQTQVAGDTNGGFNPNINDGGTAYRSGEEEYARQYAAEGNRNGVVTTTTYDQNGQVKNVVNTVPR